MLICQTEMGYYKSEKSLQVTASAISIGKAKAQQKPLSKLINFGWNVSIFEFNFIAVAQKYLLTNESKQI